MLLLVFMMYFVCSDKPFDISIREPVFKLDAPMDDDVVEDKVEDAVGANAQSNP